MAMAASASLRPDSLLRRHLCTTERSPVTRGYRFMSLLSVDRGYVERREDEHTPRVFAYSVLLRVLLPCVPVVCGLSTCCCVSWHARAVCEG